MSNRLKQLRDEIESIDQEMICLLIKRLEVAEKIGIEKVQLSLPLTDHKREFEMVKRLKSIVDDDLLKEELEPLFLEIMDISKKKQAAVKEKALPFKSIGIIGLGAMGGSIAKLIKFKQPSVHILCSDKNSKMIDAKTSNVEDLVRECECIIIATPIHTITEVAKEIKASLKTNSRLKVVFDIGSVKEEITEVFSLLTDSQVQFVSTHPMAGTEKCGFEHSSLSLLLNKTWVICPHTKNTEDVFKKVTQFIEFCGCAPKVLNAEDHDQKAALVSHFPRLISKALLEFVTEKDSKSKEIAGPGFFSMTRLAKANKELTNDILQANDKTLHRLCQDFIEFMQVRGD